MALFRMKKKNKKKGTGYKGTATPLSRAYAKFSSANVGDYIIFSSGNSYSVYNASLTRSIISSMRVYSQDAATSVGNYAIFAGGKTSYISDLVDIINNSLTVTKLPSASCLSIGRYALKAATVGNYALFAGGLDTSEERSKVVDAYNNSGTKHNSYFYPLNHPMVYHTAGSIGNYALFAGGRQKDGDTNVSYGKTVTAYNNSLTRSAPPDLTKGSYSLAAAATPDYLLIGGGMSGSSIYEPCVNIYNSALTKSIASDLSVGGSACATAANEHVLFTTSASNANYCPVEIYDNALVKSLLKNLPQKRSDLASGSIGNYVLFAGGQQYINGQGYVQCDIVDVYEVV